MRRDLLLSRGPLAAFAAMGLFWGTYAALAPALKAQAGLSDAGFGIAHLIATAGALLGLAAAPRIRRRFGARALGGTVALTAATVALPALGTGPVTFTLGLTAVCCVMGLMDVLMNAEISDVEERSGRSLMNLNHGVYSLIYAAVAVLAGILRQAGAVPVWVLGLMAAGTAGLAVAILRAPAPVPDPPDPAGRAASVPLPRHLLWAGGTLVLLAFLGEQATEGWSALHLERSHGAGAAAAAIGPALLGLTMGLGRLAGQVAIARLAPARLLGAAAILAASGGALVAAAPHLALAYVGFVALGLGLSTLVPTTFAWLGRRLDTEARGQAIARLSMIGYAGFFAGPPLMGLVAEWAGLSASFGLVAALLLLIPFVLVPILARGRAHASQPSENPLGT